MTEAVEEIIRKYPENWLWFQHRWNTPYEEAMERRQKQAASGKGAHHAPGRQDGGKGRKEQKP